MTEKKTKRKTTESPARRKPWRVWAREAARLRVGYTERAWELGGELAKLSPEEREVAIGRARSLTEPDPEAAVIPPKAKWQRKALLAMVCERALERLDDYHYREPIGEKAIKQRDERMRFWAQDLCDSLNQLEPQAKKVNVRDVLLLLRRGRSSPGRPNDLNELRYRRITTGYLLASEIAKLAGLPLWTEGSVRAAVIRRSEHDSALARNS